MKYFLSFLLYLSVSHALVAQRNWQPGFIILDGEKIPGEIDDREWPYHFETITFRKDKTSPPSQYTTQDNVDFSVKGRRYISKQINIITNSRELDQLSADTIKNRITTRGFLRQYYRGELNLFQYIDPIKKRHFFISKAGGPLIYLQYEKSLRPGKQKKILQTDNTYKFQLSQLLSSDCPEIQGSLTTTPYALKELRKIVQQWYECQGATPAFTAKVSRGKFDFSPSLQLLQSSLDIDFNNSQGETSRNRHYGPAFGAAAKYIFPGMQEKVSVKIEAFYHAFNEVSQSLSRQDGPINISLLRSVDQTSIQLSTLAEYQFSSGKIPLYIEAGFTTGSIIEFDFLFSEIRTFEDGSQVILTSSVDSALADGNDVGYVTGIGAYFGDLQIGINLMRTSRDRDTDKRIIYRLGIGCRYWL